MPAKILIDGRPVNGLPPQERDVAMVFEYNRLLPFLTVADNLAFGLTIRHTPKDEVEHRVEEQARGLRLTRLLGRKPTTLSAGEHGQVGIGRALMRKPSVFLLDEPLAHHDAVERMRMRRQIADVVHSTGVTTIYVTHDQSEALAIADRIAVLRAGTVAQIGTAHDLYAKPADLFVADFIGAVPVGLLPARLIESGGQAGFRVGARTLPLWGPVPAGCSRAWAARSCSGSAEEDIFDAGRERIRGGSTLPGIVRGVDYTGAVRGRDGRAGGAGRPSADAERTAGRGAGPGPGARSGPGVARRSVAQRSWSSMPPGPTFRPDHREALHHPAAGY